MSVAPNIGGFSQAPTPAWMIAALVALQTLAYSCQSILVTMTKTAAGDYDYDTSSAVLLAEAVKLAVALGSLAWSGQHHFLALHAFDGDSLPISGGKRKSAWQVGRVMRLLKRSSVYAIPAFLYMVHNSLIFVAHLYLSAPMFQLLNNMKIVATGVVYRVVLRRRLLVIQWLALVQVSAGMACTSLDYGAGDAPSAWWSGLAVMMLLAACSALAGVYTEVLIKTSGLPLQAGSAWLYAYSTLAALVAFLWLRPTGRQLLDGYTPVVWAMVLTNSFLGIVISFIFKHGDNTVKLFGASLAVLFTAAVSWRLFGTRTGPALWLGYALTACSLCLYYGDQGVLYSLDSDVVASCSSRRRGRSTADEEDPKLI